MTASGPNMGLSSFGAVPKGGFDASRCRTRGGAVLSKNYQGMAMRNSFVELIAVSFLAFSPLLLNAAEAEPSGAADFASRCGGCHSAQPGKNGVGPSLAGIYGSTSGNVPGYTFSPEMKNANIVWDNQNLDKFLQNPAGLVHGTKMFVSVPDATTRQKIIAYLQGLKPQAASGK